VALITSYSTLLTSVANNLNRSELTADIPGFVQNFEERFYRYPKNFGRWMEVAVSTAIASSVIAVPAAYLGLKYAYVNGAPSSRLDRMSLNQLYGSFPRGGETGIPVWISRETTNFVFGPPPDDNYTIHLVYWAKPTVMRSYTTGGADAVAHFLIVNAPDLVLYGALLEASPFLLNDERVPLWNAAYELALDAYRELQSEEDISGSPLVEILG
jgi:hypothetical protein